MSDFYYVYIPSERKILHNYFKNGRLQLRLLHTFLKMFERSKVQERVQYFIPYFNKFRFKIIQNQPSSTTDNFK
jgi:hypothetical protein